MKRLFMVLFGLASLHAAATAAKAAGEEKTPGKNAGAAASLWPEKMDPSFQGSRPECFKIWVIRNLRFPADRYDVGEEAKVEVAFAIDKNGTLTDLKVTHCEERHFADRLCKTIALSPKWSPGRTKGKPVKTELEMRFVFRLVAPPAGQEELGLCAEECDIHTTADRMPLFCGGGPDGFRAWVQRQVDSLMGPGALTEPRKLILRFVVGKDGRVTPAPKPKYRDEDALEQTVRQAIAAAPAWTPATIDGERVRFGVSMPVAFGPGAAGAEYSDKDAYRVVEVMPKFFGGGLDKFRSWVMAEVRYPSDMLKRGVQGRVVAAFVVDKEGGLRWWRFSSRRIRNFRKRSLVCLDVRRGGRRAGRTVRLSGWNTRCRSISKFARNCGSRAAPPAGTGVHPVRIDTAARLPPACLPRAPANAALLLRNAATLLNTGPLRFFCAVFDFDFHLFLQIRNFFVPLRTRNVRGTDYNKLN